MQRDCECMLTKLNLEYLNLTQLMKQESEPKKIKSLEQDMSKNLMLSKALQTYINFYRIKEAKKSA